MSLGFVALLRFSQRQKADLVDVLYWVLMYFGFGSEM